MLMSEIYSFIFLFFIVGLGFLSNFFLHRMNTTPILQFQEERNPDSFISERAYRNLKVLNDFGAKVVGSTANEVRAVNFILDYVNKVKENASNPDDIMISHQVVSGSNVFWGESHLYENIQNVVVKLQGEDDHALLMNCHFDSVAGSPGASDDLVSCCVMMEILRVLSKAEYKQLHSIIFLFNGAEEAGLLAAHGFITQHEWATDAKAVINLESTGSGGRELLFRSGPKHDWLVKMYSAAVPRPFAHAVADELFETGIIPSATDFEIFANIGGIPGLDFAYVQDGWRYHTRADSIDFIPLESIQYTGNNILPLTRKIANSDELANPPEGTSPVYFDYLGLFLISYSQTVGIIINILFSVLAVMIPFIIQTKFKLANVGFVLCETLLAFLTFFASSVLSVAACYGLSEIMNVIDRTMTWHNTTFLSIGIYGSLAIIIQIFVYHFAQKFNTFCMRTEKYREASARRKVKINLNGVTLMWSVLTILITVFGYRFAYLTMILLVVSLVTYLLTYATCKLLHKTTSQSWIFVHIFGHSFAFLFFCYLMLQLWLFFIPIVTKEYFANPDATISMICGVWSIFCLSYFIPLTLLIKFRALLYSSLITLFAVSMILAFTSVGFPYSNARHAPRLQRFMTMHAGRTIYDPSNAIIYSNGSAIVFAWERNAFKTLDKTFGESGTRDLKNDPLCEQLLDCGYPQSSQYSLDRVVAMAHYYAMPNVRATPFNLLKSRRSGSRVEIEFTLMLRTETEVSISLEPGIELNADETTVPVYELIAKGRSHYTTSVTYGKQMNQLKYFNYVLEGYPETGSIIATIGIKTVVSSFDQEPLASGFSRIMQTFPDYTFSYVRHADCSFYQITA